MVVCLSMRAIKCCDVTMPLLVSCSNWSGCSWLYEVVGADRPKSSITWRAAESHEASVENSEKWMHMLHARRVWVIVCTFPAPDIYIQFSVSSCKTCCLIWSVSTYVSRFSVQPQRDQTWQPPCHKKTSGYCKQFLQPAIAKGQVTGAVKVEIHKLGPLFFPGFQSSC